MEKSFPKYKDLITEIGSMLGSFNEKETRKDKYHIIYNTITDSDDYGTLSSGVPPTSSSTCGQTLRMSFILSTLWHIEIWSSKRNP